MAAIEIKNVKKVYGQGDAAMVALKGVDFSADTGNVVLLMGPSGAGKSTLLTIMGALQTATSGKVEIDGQDISP
jgi:putative ABC transport system ATP-binding protein